MSYRHETGAMVEIDETKSISENGDVFTFTGYASVFGNVDEGGDVMMPGAFKKSLDKHGLPLLLYQHKMDEVVGTIVDAKEDAKGLWVKGEMPKDDDFVRGRLVPQLKRKGIRGMSIGYRATDTERRKTDSARLLKSVRLFEASFVSLPMNRLAQVETVKGLVPWQDLPIDRQAKEWDAAAALVRIKAAFGERDEDIRRAFLYADEAKSVDELDPRLMIADIDESGELVANRVALYKASASLCGARGKLDFPSEEAEIAVKEHLDRYYQRLDLSGAFSQFSDGEFKLLEIAEREARLRSLGLSRKLAAQIATGLRDADRKSEPRDAGPPEDAVTLLTAALLKAADAIKNPTAG